MSNYTKTTNFATKDSLPSGNPAKIVKGTEINTEFDNIAVASATKLDSSTVSTFGATLIDDANASAARTTLGLGTAATTASTDYATAAQGTTADAALPKTGGAMTGAITTNSTFDGRDVATDGTKLDGIEASADVTDTTNVTAAGALMDSEVTNLAQVKAFDSADYATAAQGTLADNALPKSGGTMTGTLTLGNNTINDVEDIYLRDKLYHDADTDTYLGFGTNQINLVTGGSTGLILYQNYLQAYENVVGSVHLDTNQGTGTHYPDFQNYNSFVWTLTGNITLGNPSTEIAGMSGVFIFTHSGAGRTVSPQNQYETIDGGALTLSGTAGAVDIVPYFVRSTSNIMLGKPLLNFVNAS